MMPFNLELNSARVPVQIPSERMIRWLIMLTWLGHAAGAWGAGGGMELRRQARIQNFWQLLGKAPDSVEVVREGALRAAALGDTALCRRLFLEGASQYPEQAGLLYFELGGAMSRLGRPEAAVVAFRRALETRSGMRVSFAYYALATLHERRGEVEQAWKVYQELLADDAALPIHIVEAAAFALRQGKGEAQPLFELALERGAKEGTEMEARVLRRWAGLQAGEEALTLYERLHAGTESEPADYQRAGVLAAELHLEKRWEGYFREGMRRHPEARGWLQFELAVQLEKANRIEEALELFRAAKQDPCGLKAGFADVALAKLLEKTGKTAEAGQILGELLRSTQALPVHVAEVAGFEARQGRVERGLELYLQAYQLAREEEDQIAVGNALSDGIRALPGLTGLAQWFRLRTEPFSAEEKKRLRRALATTFGNHAWKLLTEGSFVDAGTSSEMALLIYAPDILKWVEGNRAHAYLFLGRVKEAREIHERYREEPLELEGFDWKKAVREDFKTFRENGLVKGPVEIEMRKLEGLLGIDGNGGTHPALGTGREEIKP